VALPVLHRGYLWGSSTAMALDQFSTMALGIERTGDIFLLYWLVDAGGGSSSIENTDYCISSYCVQLYAYPGASI